MLIPRAPFSLLPPEIVVGGDPGVQTEFSVTVPTGETWVLHSVHAELTTDATVANRQVFLVIDDGVNNLYASPDAGNHGASGTVPYSWAPGVPLSQGIASGSRRVAPIPYGFLLKEGWRVRSITGSMQAGDNWAAPRLIVSKITA